MSLLDTIKGARAEAEEAQGARTKKADDTTAEAEATPTKSGYARKTAANAKPTRAAAGSPAQSSAPHRGWDASL